MYKKKDKAFALDLWFAMSPTMSLQQFCDELGWPGHETMRRWVRADPRDDPDKARHDSRPILVRLEALRRIADGVPRSRAARELGMSENCVARDARLYSEGGTAALLPRRSRPVAKRGGAGAAAGGGCANDNAGARGGASAAGGRARRDEPWARPPEVPDELPDDPAALKAIIGELRLDNAVLREVLDVLKADPGCVPSALTNREKATVAERLASRFGAAGACARLGLARSTYYHQLGAMTRPDPRPWLDAEVRRAFEGAGGGRGYRYVHAVVVARRGPVSEKLVRDSMRRQGLVPAWLRRRRRKAWSSYRGEIDEAAPNLPLRPDGTHDFSAPAPNVLWVSDITEFRLPGDARKVYLSPVLDMFDGRAVSWSVGMSPDAALANSSLAAACATLAPGESPVVHTDRGSHYRWDGWKAICAEHGLTRSMSRKATSPDNAACEGFFGVMKREMFLGRDWSGWDAESLCGVVDGWMRAFNSERPRPWREGGRTVWETPDEHRRRLGYAV